MSAFGGSTAPYPPVQNGKEKRGGLLLPADYARLVTTAERAGIAALLAPPVVSVYRTAALNITNNVLTSPVTWDAVAFDTHGMWGGGAPTRLTIPAGWGGYWYFNGGCEMVANATGIREGYLRANGASYRIKALGYANATQAAQPSPAGLLQLAAGEYLELVPFQNSGGALAVNPAQYTVFLTGTWVRS